MPLLSKNRHMKKLPRSGFTLLVAMVLLVIISTLAITWARRAILQQRQMSQRLQQMQSEWLATSAVQRAMHELAADPNFEQETWSLSPADLKSTHGASIDIRVVPGEKTNVRQLEVVVDYPNDPLLRQRVRRIQQVIVPSPENPS